MNTPGIAAPGRGALELPPFSLDVQALDLGGDVKAVGLELVGTENREPVRGKDAAEIWSAVFPALAGNESYAVDFFSHIERVKEFCKMREIALRDAAERCVVLPQPNQEQLRYSGRPGVAIHRCRARRQPFRARAGCVPAGLRPLHVLRHLRTGRRLGDVAERVALAQRSHPPGAAGGSAF
jgi:hypothetical protein